jgi:hypothetical protein
LSIIVNSERHVSSAERTSRSATEKEAYVSEECCWCGVVCEQQQHLCSLSAASISSDAPFPLLSGARDDDDDDADMSDEDEFRGGRGEDEDDESDDAAVASTPAASSSQRRPTKRKRTRDSDEDAEDEDDFGSQAVGGAKITAEVRSFLHSPLHIKIVPSMHHD